MELLVEFLFEDLEGLVVVDDELHFLDGRRLVLAVQGDFFDQDVGTRLDREA